MDIINTIGIAAGALTTVSFVPQVVKTYKTRSTKDIASGMFVVLGAGVVLWIVYGVMVNSLPVILANSCTLVLVAALIALKIKYR